MADVVITVDDDKITYLQRYRPGTPLRDLAEQFIDKRIQQDIDQKYQQLINGPLSEDDRRIALMNLP